MAERGELSPALEAVEQFAVARPEFGADGLGLRRPDHAIPPQTETIRAELRSGDRELLHCLECGRQLAALRHEASCLFCGSSAVVVESWG